MDAARTLTAMNAISESISAHKEYLTELDSAIGDADHGINLTRGFSKALEKLRAGTYRTAGAVLKDVAMAMMSSVGGASGPLYGTLFMKASQKLGNKEVVGTAELAEALEEGLKGIVALGKASLGDKTMVDALTPAVDAMRGAAAEGADLVPALEKAVAAAQKGMESTIPLVARKGRASYLGERSAGHQDPGATSTFLILSALLESVKAG